MGLERGAPLAGAHSFWELVDLQPVDLALVREEQHVIVRAGDEERAQDVALLGLGALDGALELELLEVAGRGDVTMVKVLQHILL